MNVEENRLRSFSNWPANSVIEPTRIAKGGFYATGNNTEVQCFACKGKIDSWNYGDQVMARHRSLNPTCPFVLNPNASGNIPITPIASSSSSSASAVETNSAINNTDDMTIEINRLITYAKWPSTNIVTPESLAKAGFYYLNEQDKVKCFKCSGMVGKWVEGDQPVEEHKRLFPNCEFIRQFFTPGDKSKISIAYNEQVISQKNFQELGIQMHKGAHQSKYATFEARLRSFEGWPDELVQTPESLAEAGFYYTGSYDLVRCFNCDGGLRRWDPEDEPWTEHARCFPTCSFLLLVKGQMFVDRCSEANGSSDTIVDCPTRATGTVPFDRVRLVSDHDLQQMMDSPEARAALGIGLHVGRVKQAIKYKVEHTGTPFSTADALIEAALNVQLEESDSMYDTDADSDRFSETVARLISETVCSNLLETANKTASSSSSTSSPSTAKAAEVADSTSQNVTVSNISLEEENRRLKEARLCKICLDLEVGVVFLPCGHLATCINCAPSLKDCPVCRSSIKAFVRTFLS